MIDIDKYENMRLLFLDFIDTASDEVDEEAWRGKLTMLDELLAEVKRLQIECRALGGMIQWYMETGEMLDRDDWDAEGVNE